MRLKRLWNRRLENVRLRFKRIAVCRWKGHRWIQTYRHLEDLEPLFVCTRCYEEMD